MKSLGFEGFGSRVQGTQQTGFRDPLSGVMRIYIYIYIWGVKDN